MDTGRPNACKDQRLKKAMLITYGISYAALILFNAFWTLSLEGSSVLAVLVSLLFPAIYLTGLWGYTFEQKIGTATMWRVFFFLLCLSTASALLIEIMISRGTFIVFTAFSLVFTMPMLYFLHQYSKGQQSFWLNSTQS
jgi:hypothetical protein